VVDTDQPPMCCIAGSCRELLDQFIAARIGQAPLATTESVHTGREIDHDDIVSSGISVDRCRDKHPRKCTKEELRTLEEAPEPYRVVLIPNLILGCRNRFLVGFEYVSYFDKGRRLGTA